MELIKIHDKTFEPYISAQQLEEINARMAAEVYQDLGESRPVFVAVLNGSFMFAADFVRHYKGECEISFVKMSSYEGTQSTGKVHELIGLSGSVEGRDVVILEDIVDTGTTLHYLLDNLKARGAKSVRLVALLNKPERRKMDVDVDYVGFTVPDYFVVGYGLDYAERYRQLPYIGILKESVYQ